MKIKVFTLNAFAKTEDGGNPAGVVLNSDALSEKQMLLISKKVGFSETAFVQKSDKADFRIKFFTPNAEVDLCGHATIAAFYLLVDKKIIRPGKYTQETKAGVLAIEISLDKKVFMSQSLPKYFDIIDKSIIVEYLNIPQNYLINDLPIQIVSTGGIDMFIPINSLEKLFFLKPDHKRLIAVSKKYSIEGFCFFSQETKFDSTAHFRSFAPLVGILEDAACGVQAGALACYLFKYNKRSIKNKNDLIFEQGYSMNKPSEIRVKLNIRSNDITKVNVGGVATNIQEIEVKI